MRFPGQSPAKQFNQGNIHQWTISYAHRHLLFFQRPRTRKKFFVVRKWQFARLNRSRIRTFKMNLLFKSGASFPAAVLRNFASVSGRQLSRWSPTRSRQCRSAPSLEKRRVGDVVSVDLSSKAFGSIGLTNSAKYFSTCPIRLQEEEKNKPPQVSCPLPTFVFVYWPIVIETAQTLGRSQKFSSDEYQFIPSFV